MSIKHSGEIESSTIIMVVAVILFGAIIGLLFPIFGTKYTKKDDRPKQYSQGEKVIPVSERVTDAYYTKADIDTAVCGIKVFSPLPGQKVGFPLEISGYVNGCNWVPFEGNVATLVVRDQYKNLTNEIIVPIESDDLTLPAYFKIKISLKEKPESNTGILIFKNDKNSNSNIETFQVPIQF